MAAAVLVPLLTSAGVSAATAATIGTVVSTVGTVMTIGSVVGSAVSGMNAAKQQAASEAGAARFNADVAQQNIGITKAQTDQQVKDLQRTQYLARGTNVANAGGSGLGLSGSSLDVLADNAAQGQLDILNTKYQGDLTVRGYQNSANLDISQAAGRIGVGTSILGGVTDLAKISPYVSLPKTAAKAKP